MAAEHPAELIPKKVLECFADVLQMPLARSATGVRGNREVHINLGPLKFPFDLRLVSWEVWIRGGTVIEDHADVGLYLRGPGDFALTLLYESKPQVVWAMVGDAMSLPAPDNGTFLAALGVSGTRAAVARLLPEAHGTFRIFNTDGDWENLTAPAQNPA